MHTQLIDALTKLQTHADELRDLDSELGDGDLGITVSQGARAVQVAVRELDEQATLKELLRVSAEAFGNANPSTFASLIQGALLAAATAVEEESSLTVASLARVLEAASDNIAKRGKADPGDKTVLDALLASKNALDPFDDLDEKAVQAMIDAADQETTRLALELSKRGRAAWVGERGKGHKDAGSVAYIRFLEAVNSVH